MATNRKLKPSLFSLFFASFPLIYIAANTRIKNAPLAQPHQSVVSLISMWGVVKLKRKEFSNPTHPRHKSRWVQWMNEQLSRFGETGQVQLLERKKLPSFLNNTSNYLPYQTSTSWLINKPTKTHKEKHLIWCFWLGDLVLSLSAFLLIN